MKYGDISVKQYSQVTYLGCILDQSFTGESMALHVINKVNKKLKFLYRQKNFLTPGLRRLLCNAIIQPHFDYACTTWFPMLNKKYKKKLQVMQNKFICFCLQLGSRSHIGYREFESINWLPVDLAVCVVSSFQVFPPTLPKLHI